MQVNATSAAVEPRPLVFAGLPATSWAFAIRIWIAVILALYASFWLELEAPSSAAITVAILALPTRGQAMEKAGFRLIATVIGVAASIAIAGFFSQTDGLLLAVFSAWIGLCVYAAGMLDGNRAYAAALCCITVALIAVQQIDSPQQVFPTGVARGAAIASRVRADQRRSGCPRLPSGPVDPPRSLASSGRELRRGRGAWRSGVLYRGSWPATRHRGRASGDREPCRGIEQWKRKKRGGTHRDGGSRHRAVFGQGPGSAIRRRAGHALEPSG
jgi:hypothetical protein